MKKAIQWIDGRVLELSCLADITSTDKGIQRINEEYNALLIARTCIYKQIPEKPEIKETKQPFSKFGKSGILQRTMYFCPVCGQHLYTQNHFEYTDEYGSGLDRCPAGSTTPCCHKCGQALKWEG